MTRFTISFAAVAVLAVALSTWIAVRPNQPSTTQLNPAVPVGSAAVSTAVSTGSGPQAPAPLAVIERAKTKVSATEAAAVATAAAAVALAAPRMTTPEKARALTKAISARDSEPALVEQAERQLTKLRAQLGDVTVLAHPLRARTIHYDATRAVVDIWWVKVLTGDHLAYVADIWGTTRFTLTYETGAWRVASEDSDLGPWPTHSATAVTHLSGPAFNLTLDGYQPVTRPHTTPHTTPTELRAYEPSGVSR